MAAVARGNWLIGSAGLLSPGERVEMTVNLTDLTTPLGVSTEFTIEVKPSIGAVLVVNRTTAAEFTAVVDLK